MMGSSVQPVGTNKGFYTMYSLKQIDSLFTYSTAQHTMILGVILVSLYRRLHRKTFKACVGSITWQHVAMVIVFSCLVIMFSPMLLFVLSVILADTHNSFLQFTIEQRSVPVIL